MYNVSKRLNPFRRALLNHNTVFSWASAHGRSAITPCFLLYWALTMCKIETQLVGVVKGTIATATRSRSLLASASACIAE